MAKIHVKTGDVVIVNSGKDASGKEPKMGKVIQVSPSEGKVIVEGIHVISKHVKPQKQGEAGGIINTEGAIYASKVNLYCPKCKKGVRVKHPVVNDEKVRVCAKCGEQL